MNCDVCGEEISGGSAFTCNYCGGVFCPKHRLPFNHSCKNLEQWKKAGTPVTKSTRYQKNHVSSGFLVKRRNELLILAALVICLLFIIGVFFL
ncbi:MAG: hypothetical protein GXY48_09340 [Methanomicrobiales archaeon]|nr:hypothetical protein [Methanomicrobiales archaeon]